MLSNQPTNTTQTTRHQHSPTRTKSLRQHQNVLTDMPRLAHETKRLGSATHIPPAHRQRPQRTPLEKPQQLPEHRLNTLRTGVHQIKRSINQPRMSTRDLNGITNIALAHLDEPATIPQQPKRHINELPSQTIKHDSHAQPTRYLTETLTKLKRARGRDVLLIQPHPTQNTPLTRTSRREHLNTQISRQLNSSHPNTTRPRVHQQPLTLTNTSEIHKRVIRRKEHDRHRRGLRERPTIRHPLKQTMISDRDRPKRTIKQTHHTITRPKPHNTSTNTQHHTRPLTTNTRILWINTKRDQHVTKIQTSRTHPHPHLTRTQNPLRPHNPNQRQILKAAAPTLPQTPHRPASRDPQQTQRTSPHKPRNTHNTIAHNHLRLPTPQHTRQRLPRGLLTININEYKPAGILRLSATHQTPHRRTHKIHNTLTSTHSHRTTSHHHKPTIPKPPLRQPLPQQTQHPNHTNPHTTNTIANYTTTHRRRDTIHQHHTRNTKTPIHSIQQPTHTIKHPNTRQQPPKHPTTNTPQHPTTPTPPHTTPPPTPPPPTSETPVTRGSPDTSDNPGDSTHSNPNNESE